MYTVTAKDHKGKTVWLHRGCILIEPDADAYWSYDMPKTADDCFESIKRVDSMLAAPGFISYMYASPANDEYTYMKMTFKIEANEVIF